MSWTASMVPEQRSCCRTIDGVKRDGFFSELGLMHLKKWACDRGVERSHELAQLADVFP